MKIFKANYLSLAIAAITACICIISCNGGSNNNSSRTKSNPDTADTNDLVTIQESDQLQSNTDTAIEIMDEKDIRLNGKLQRYFSLKEFKRVLGEPDSTKLLLDEEPCTTIFQEPDGSVDSAAKYLFKNGSRFESTKGKVAIDEIKFTNGDFIVFKNTTLNKHTSVAELKKLFPNAGRHISDIDVAGEGKLQVMELREDKDNISDGHIKIFIKNGKLYSLHWWFPC